MVHLQLSCLCTGSSVSILLDSRTLIVNGLDMLRVGPEPYLRAGKGFQALPFVMLLRYWTFPQMVAHHTAGGCNLQPGDLLGSGTVSGPKEQERGCLLELTWAGKEKVQLCGPDGGSVERTYLLDGDEVVFRGRCEGGTVGVPGIGFGECRGKLLPCAYKQQ